MIDYCIAPSENIEVWTELLQNMKSRGLKQVELFLSDGVKRKAKPKAEFPNEQSLDTFNWNTSNELQ